MHSTEKKALALNLLLSLLMAAGYMLLFAYNNTPLGAAIGSDNAMYLTMGTALAKGWAPYVDVFDHKGPLLFALQGLPQWIGGGYNLTAVFLQEVVALFACLTVVRALARVLSCPPVWAQLVYLAMTCAFMDGGNLTEEYTNLPTLLALYMALRVFGQEKIGEKLFLPAAGMGVCAAAAFSLRANNALPIFALVAVLAAGLAITQRFAQLGQCAAGFTLGLLAVFLPILIWLAAKGALSAAWYGAIIHNMMYADSGTGDRFAALFTTSYGHMAMIVAAFSCAGALAVWKKRRAPLLALAMLAAAAARRAGRVPFPQILHPLPDARRAAGRRRRDGRCQRFASAARPKSRRTDAGRRKRTLAGHQRRVGQRGAPFRARRTGTVRRRRADPDGTGAGGRARQLHGLPRRAQVVCRGKGSALHALLLPSGDSGASRSGGDG